MTLESKGIVLHLQPELASAPHPTYVEAGPRALPIKCGNCDMLVCSLVLSNRLFYGCASCGLIWSSQTIAAEMLILASQLLGYQADELQVGFAAQAKIHYQG